jgi:hypothetical protein
MRTASARCPAISKDTLDLGGGAGAWPHQSQRNPQRAGDVRYGLPKRSLQPSRMLRKAVLVIEARAFFSNSRRVPQISIPGSSVTPVRLPPGRARLSISPAFSGVPDFCQRAPTVTRAWKGAPFATTSVHCQRTRSQGLASFTFHRPERLTGRPRGLSEFVHQDMRR